MNTKKPAPAKVPILDRDEALLRATARPVTLEEIKTPEFKNILERMRSALYGEDDGVAIAAPQIGESLRVFMIKGSTLSIAKGEEVRGDEPDLIFINPEILKVSKKKKDMEEGCLSVRWLYGFVPRHEKVTITALNEKGEKITAGASGLLAQVFQHEIDHLEGILFIDKAHDLKDLPPENENKENE